jgi:hypothetical protein
MKIKIVIGIVLIALAGGVLLIANLGNSFQFKEDLRDEYLKAGGKCLESDSFSHERRKESGYFCEGGNWLSIYKDKDELTKMAKLVTHFCGDPASCDRGAIKGDNWLLVTDSPQFYADKLGGELLFLRTSE